MAGWQDVQVDLATAAKPTAASGTTSTGQPALSVKVLGAVGGGLLLFGAGGAIEHRHQTRA
jgi:hypothetical protein